MAKVDREKTRQGKNNRISLLNPNILFFLLLTTEEDSIYFCEVMCIFVQSSCKFVKQVKFDYSKLLFPMQGDSGSSGGGGVILPTMLPPQNNFTQMH